MLDARVGAQVSVRAVGLKVLLDDMLFVPLVEIPTFFAWTATAEGESPVERLRAEYVATAMAGWAFNVPLTVLNFTVVPPHFRVIVLDVADCVWSGILSYSSHRSVGGKAADVT